MTQTPAELAAYLLQGIGTHSEGPAFACPTCSGSTVLRLFATTQGTYLVGMGTALDPDAAQPCDSMAHPLKGLQPGQVWTMCDACKRTVWAWESAEGHPGVRSSVGTGLDGRLEVPKVLEIGNGGLSFTMAAHPEVVARLLVVCTHHPEEHLAMWERDRDGTTTFTHAESVRVESIAEPVAHSGAHGLFREPEAPPAEGDEAHLRYVFRCPKPSCSYNGQVIGSKLTPKVEQVLDFMVATGAPFMRTRSPEADGTLKPV